MDQYKINETKDWSNIYNYFKEQKTIGIATKNPGKFRAFCELLNELDLEVVFLNELKTVEESDSAKENAIQKAIVASRQVDIPVLSTDENIFLSFLKDEEQPNARIKRIVNYDPTDEEMIEYYLNILEKLENKTGLGIIETYSVIAYKSEVCNMLYEKDTCFFKYPGSKILIKGRPLASLDYHPKYKKYYTELTNEEKEDINNQARKLISDFVNKTLIGIYKDKI